MYDDGDDGDDDDGDDDDDMTCQIEHIHHFKPPRSVAPLTARGSFGGCSPQGVAPQRVGQVVAAPVGLQAIFDTSKIKKP